MKVSHVVLHFDGDEDVRYVSGESKGQPWEAIHLGWDSTLFFTDPDQLNVLAAMATEAEQSLRLALGQKRCDCCSRWESETFAVRSGDDFGDLCADCVALAQEAA